MLLKWSRVGVFVFVLIGSLRGWGRDLAEEFREPPASARPWVYWFFMDGNLSREGITADLEAMQQAGIGGVILMEVDVGIPEGPVQFMSEPWLALFKHAVNEAERLGLEITLNAGPGWTGSGGPWVKPGAVHAAPRRQRDQGHGRAAVRGSPGRSRSRGRHSSEPVPRELEPLRSGFYRDVAVLAFPTPAGEGIASPIWTKRPCTCERRIRRSPASNPILPAPAEYPALPEDGGHCPGPDRGPDRPAGAPRAGSCGTCRRATGPSCVSAGPPPGPTRGRRPQSGLGFECDKFDPAALDAHFDAFVGRLLRESRAAPGAPHRRLDDAAHRQLGDGRPELDASGSATSSSAGAGTICSDTCRS